MEVKELREIIKGLKGSVNISTGNYTGYSPKESDDTINITLSHINNGEELTKRNEDLKKSNI